MATYHTDYLLGNDTTGNGSAALPWKTITKAYTVATTNDTIKVAGSTLSDVPGLTLTSAGGTSYNYTANIDPTGLIAEGDCISLTDPTWGADKFFFRVTAIAGTTVRLSGPSLPGIAMNVRKFSQIHYATSTTNVTFETTGTITATNISVLGGWNSDFTVQDGWTVVRYQNTTDNSRSGTFMTNAANNSYRDRFAIFHMVSGWAGGTRNEYWGDMIFVNTTNMFGATPSTITNNVKWYIQWSDAQSGTQITINPNGTYGLSIDEFYTIKTSNSNSGFRFLAMGVNTQYLQASIAGGGDITTTNTGILPAALGCIVGDTYLNIIPTGDHYIKIMPAAGGIQYLWNGRLIFVNQSTTLQDDGGVLVWNNPTQNINTFRWWTNGNTSPPFTNDFGAVFAYDSEGAKVSQLGNGLQFADSSTYVTGSNSLRSTRIGRGAGQSGVSNIAQFRVDTGSTSVSITITAKNDSASNIVERFVIFTTGINFSIVPATLQTTQSLNNTWTTWTWTITNADAIAAMKTKLNVLTWINQLNVLSTYLWVDNVVITQS